MPRTSLVMLALISACGTSSPAASDPPPAPTPVPATPAPIPTIAPAAVEPFPPPTPEPPPAPTEAAPIATTPTAAEQLLAARRDGTAVLVLHIGDRRFVVLGAAEANDANEGETIDTAYGHLRLEDGATVITPRALALASSAPCVFHTTQTFRAETWTDEAEDATRALYLAEGTTDDCAIDDEGTFAILGDALPTVDHLGFEALDEESSGVELARLSRSARPRPPAGSYASAATRDHVHVVVSYSEPDEDACVYLEVTYVVRADHSVTTILGMADDRLFVIAGVRYLWVLDASMAAGRPATHMRVLALDARGPALLDTDVPIPWMSGPNC
jgi:hypothetical protein